jgi:hypothetical protein
MYRKFAAADVAAEPRKRNRSRRVLHPFTPMNTGSKPYVLRITAIETIF